MNHEKKRTKGKNFSDKEIGILIDLIEENVNIIENKKTDALNSKLKNETWEKITQNFNTRSNTEERTITQIKNFYDNFKRKTKKDYEDYMAQLYKTGGETLVKKLDTLEERLINLLQKQFELDKNIFDISTYQESQNLYNGNQGLIEINSIEEIDIKNEKDEDIIRKISKAEVHNNSNILEETPKIINKDKEKMPIKKRKTTDVHNSEENLTAKISEENIDNELAKLKAEYAKEKLDKIREENQHLKRKHLLEEKKIENEIILQEMQIEQEKIKLAIMKRQNSLV